jgi:hypothetical protein
MPQRFSYIDVYRFASILSKSRPMRVLALVTTLLLAHRPASAPEHGATPENVELASRSPLPAQHPGSTAAVLEP